MGWETDAVQGYAGLLAAAGVGTYAPTIASGQPGAGNIYCGALPADVVPGIGIQGYRVRPDDPQNPNTELRIQLWLRAATLTALADLDSAAYNALQGLHGAQFGTVTVTDTQSVSAVPMGVDGNGNYERACNYAADLELPPTALRSY